MQYVRSIAGSVTKTYNSLNPATLSGAIDVIVIEQEDGTLACSPFHVRFGKFSLLRPSEKKVEFRVNGEKQEYAMKLGDGGEAFFVFETDRDIPPSMQTSPLVSPAQSPETLKPERPPTPILGEPTYLDIAADSDSKSTPETANIRGAMPILRRDYTTSSDQILYGSSLPMDRAAEPTWSQGDLLPPSQAPTLMRAASEEVIPLAAKDDIERINESVRRGSFLLQDSLMDEPPSPKKSSASPPALRPSDAYDRALTLSKKLSTSNIRSKVTETGDLMLDMTGYKSSEDDALRAEAIARKLLSEELEGNYDIGSLIGTDENGNLWIYSSEEAKDAANRKAINQAMGSTSMIGTDSASDPGYHSDSDRSSSPVLQSKTHIRAQSEEIPTTRASSESHHFAKTLRLTSPQLKKLNLKPGPNPVSFTVNKSTCTASMYLWRHDVPIVISDIDGTITKSDALGHILNMVGRDWTHIGVAKLYSDIVANGYNIFYLTSRSVGQADTTRAYLNGVAQDGWKLPKGPVIMSPDRTIAALRREVYLRKPEVFKMACLRDILGLFPGRNTPFYAGFGNRFTDALSYRTVNIPSSRIFTINSNAEVSLDLLSLNKYRSSYVTMREVVDHFFPPVATLVKEGGEDYTDFKYWRDDLGNLDDFVPSDSEGEDEDVDDEEDDEEEYEDDGLGESYISRDSIDTSQLDESVRESIEVDETDVDQLRIVDTDDYVDDYLGSGRRTPTRQRTTP